MKKYIKLIKRNKRIFIPLAVSVSVVTIVLAVIFTSPFYRLRKALNPENREYDKVQVEILQEFEYFSAVEDGETESVNEATEIVTILKKDGSVYVESTPDGDIYYEDGMKKSFDFGLLKEINPELFDMVDNRFIPKDEYIHEVFYTLFGIQEKDYRKYMIWSFSIELDGSCLKHIQTTYTYDNDCYVTQNYTFQEHK